MRFLEKRVQQMVDLKQINATTGNIADFSNTSVTNMWYYLYYLQDYTDKTLSEIKSQSDFGADFVDEEMLESYIKNIQNKKPLPNIAWNDKTRGKLNESKYSTQTNSVYKTRGKCVYDFENMFKATLKRFVDVKDKDNIHELINLLTDKNPCDDMPKYIEQHNNTINYIANTLCIAKNILMYLQTNQHGTAAQNNIKQQLSKTLTNIKICENYLTLQDPIFSKLTSPQQEKIIDKYYAILTNLNILISQLKSKPSVAGLTIETFDPANIAEPKCTPSTFDTLVDFITTSNISAIQYFEEMLSLYYNDILGCLRIYARLRSYNDKIPKKLQIQNRKTIVLNKKQCYNFTGVYDSTETNEDIVGNGEKMSDFIHNFKLLEQGYSVCVMVYGYSGSGKTFILFGDDGNGDGIIEIGLQKLTNVTIDVEYIFELYERNVSLAGVKEITSDVIILYDKTVTDAKKNSTTVENSLYNILQALGIDKSFIKSNNEHDHIKITVDTTGKNFLKVLLKTIHEIQISSKTETDHRIKSTPNNKGSSRSHTFIVLRITSGKTVSFLTICDLAGSESPINIYEEFFNKAKAGIPLLTSSKGLNDLSFNFLSDKIKDGFEEDLKQLAKQTKFGFDYLNTRYPQVKDWTLNDSIKHAIVYNQDIKLKELKNVFKTKVNEARRQTGSKVSQDINLNIYQLMLNKIDVYLKIVLESFYINESLLHLKWWTNQQIHLQTSTSTITIDQYVANYSTKFLISPKDELIKCKQNICSITQKPPQQRKQQHARYDDMPKETETTSTIQSQCINVISVMTFIKHMPSIFEFFSTNEHKIDTFANFKSAIAYKLQKKNTTNIPYTTKFDQKYFDTLTENGQKIVENIATDIENVGQSDGNFKLIILGALTPVAAGTDGKPDEDKAYNDNVETVNFLRSLLPTTLAQTCDPIPAPPATDRAIPIAWA